ncbi:NAD(+) diphosphatase [Psychrobacter jeotgali]|uniref:NAD(+) diphosphatase n=1 Tax=Psychrobacter jeotgali TaxID=179010 RepID=UPI00191A9DD8|nr:NAD(+) diphosphatase [Psychrobacter jeotgali]
MSSAFVLHGDTILCRQTNDGWWPYQVSLPALDPPLYNTNADSGAIKSSDHNQRYQIGRVTLLASLAPKHWINESKDNKLKVEQDQRLDAPATFAITSDYALAHHIAIPEVREANVISSADSVGSQFSQFEFISYRQLIVVLPVAIADQLSQAIQLLRWQADTQFCSRCSSPVDHAKLGERAMVCPACQLRQYPRVQPCIITAITRPNPTTGETQILLAQHHRHGQKIRPLQYGLLAGFVEVGESLEHAVVREVEEEVGITLKDIRYVSSQPWPFPSNLMLGFRAAYSSGDIVWQESELSHAAFFDLSNLPKIPPKGSIAHELIAQIIQEQKDKKAGL